MTDIWSSKQKKDCLAIGAVITNECFDREILILDIRRLEERHKHEYIQDCLESMIQEFEIKRDLIHGFVSDQGKNITAIFRYSIITDNGEHQVIDLEKLCSEQETATADITIASSGSPS